MADGGPLPHTLDGGSSGSAPADSGPADGLPADSILPGTRAAWKLDFRDELDGPSVDATKWTTTITPFGDQSLAGNAEEECYLPGNFVFGDGKLQIVARKENVKCTKPAFDAKYTSGAMITSGKYSMRYGYFEVRAKVPKGQGLWPAFWLMPDDKSWPPEIDVFEFVNRDTTSAFQTIHYKGPGDKHESDGSTANVADASADFHLYGLTKRENVLTWYVDGVKTKEVTHDVPNTPFYVLLNLAVGGSWPKSPDATTPFPSSMTVDFVRTYSCNDWSRCI